MTDLLAAATTLLTAIYIGRLLYRLLDARWETEARRDYELPASQPAVRVIPPVVDWESSKWL